MCAHMKTLTRFCFPISEAFQHRFQNQSNDSSVTCSCPRAQVSLQSAICLQHAHICIWRCVQITHSKDSVKRSTQRNLTPCSDPRASMPAARNTAILTTCFGKYQVRWYLDLQGTPKCPMYLDEADYPYPTLSAFFLAIRAGSLAQRAAAPRRAVARLRPYRHPVIKLRFPESLPLGSVHQHPEVDGV